MWECRCECGEITYKATDTLTNPDLSMCYKCAQLYAAEQARANAGFVEGTQLGQIRKKQKKRTIIPVTEESGLTPGMARTE